MRATVWLGVRNKDVGNKNTPGIRGIFKASGKLPAALTAVATKVAARALFARAGFVDSDRAAAEVGAVKGLLGSFAFVVVLELDKAKALAAAGVAVLDYGSRSHRAMGSEDVAQLIVGGSEWQATYK